MAQPINYLIDVQNPVESYRQGYENRLKQQAFQQQQQALRQQQESARQMQVDLANLANNPNASAQDFSRMMIKYPQLTDHFKKSWDVLNEEQKTNSLKQVIGVDSALQSGNTDVAISLLEEQKQAALNAGDDAKAKGAETIIKQIEMNSQVAKTGISAQLASIMGAEKFADYRQKTGAVSQKQFRVLSDEEKKDLGLDTKKAYQIGSDGKITSIGGGGVSVNVDTKGNFGTIPPGWVLKEKDGQYTMEIIPGSPADIKAKELAKKKIETSKLEKRAGDVVISDIGRLKKKIEDSSFFSPITGTLAQKIPEIFAQDRVDAEELQQTIVANVGFDRLQQMREASATGGALGQVSDRELSTLQAVLGSLKLKQSEKQLLTNLTRLDKIYRQILETNKKMGITGWGPEQVTVEQDQVVTPEGEASVTTVQENRDPLGLGI